VSFLVHHYDAAGDHLARDTVLGEGANIAQPLSPAAGLHREGEAPPVRMGVHRHPKGRLPQSEE
jgi:hypothetical protein